MTDGLLHRNALWQAVVNLCNLAVPVQRIVIARVDDDRIPEEVLQQTLRQVRDVLESDDDDEDLCAVWALVHLHRGRTNLPGDLTEGFGAT
jgi:hypothetical protein